MIAKCITNAIMILLNDQKNPTESFIQHPELHIHIWTKSVEFLPNDKCFFYWMCISCIHFESRLANHSGTPVLSVEGRSGWWIMLEPGNESGKKMRAKKPNSDRHWKPHAALYPHFLEYVLLLVGHIHSNSGKLAESSFHPKIWRKILK